MALRNELDKLRVQKSRKTSSIWRRVGIALCSALAAGILVAGNLVFWAGRSLVDSDRYIAITAPLIEQPAVQEAIATQITDAIYSQVDIEALTAEALPPRAAFLVNPLSGQLRNYTKQTLQSILASQKFQDIWVEAQTTIHDKVISTLRDYKGNGVIDLNDVYDRVTAQLADTKLSFLASKQLPDSVGSITIVNATWLPIAHNLVVNMNLYRIVSILGFLLASAGAILLSKNKRRQIILLSILFAVCAFLILVSIGFAKNMLVAEAAGSNKEAVKQAGQIVFSGLVTQTRLLLATSLIVWLLAWISGPYQSARFFRDRINVLLSGNIHQSLFGKHENKLTKFIGRHQTQLFWGYTAVISLILLFASISASRLIAFIVSLAIVAVILEILAEPK